MAVSTRNAGVREYGTAEATGACMKSYMCVICGYVYNEADGEPDGGVAAGTQWDKVPPNWVCPECGARKEDFEMVEI
jgi:rubredoxin